MQLQAWPVYLGFILAKMAQYYHFWKFLARKHRFGNKQQSTTFSRTRVSETRVPHQFSIVALLSWICAIKKICAVLKLGKLEYHLHNTRVYQARVPFFKKKKLHSTRVWSTRVLCKFFFFLFLFGDNQQINIKIKISSFFMFLFI